jgi:hypothetical protein
MLKVDTHDGTVFEGDDAKDIVRQMKMTEWGHPEKKRDYMEEVAERIEQMTGSEVPHGSAASFLLGLAEAGLITITSDGVQLMANLLLHGSDALGILGPLTESKQPEAPNEPEQQG